MHLALLDLIAPSHCAGCGATGPGGAPLCPACAPAFAAPPWRVPVRPPPGAAPPPPVWSAAVYRGPARAAVVAYKERGRRELAPLLAALLARAVGAARPPVAPGSGSPPRMVLVPVPTRRAAASRRGDHPVRRLAARAARATGAAVLDALRHRRPVADQAGLGAGERAANVSGAFHVPPAHRSALHTAIGPARAGPASVIVIDDVCTTGATLAEAGRALAAAGVPVAGAAVVAATVLRVVRAAPAAQGVPGPSG